MSRQRHQFFSLHELLVIAALAALGGVTNSAVSMVRAAIHAVIVVPGGMQFLAGIHVVWLVIALGLIRKPGTGTVTGLLAGVVELLSGNPHGLLVVMYAGLAGVAMDAVWLLLGGRDHLVTYLLAAGVGAASNVAVFAFTASLPTQDAVLTALALMAVVAFISGAILGGLLGWWLLGALRRAGVVGVQPQTQKAHGKRRTWASVGAMGLTIALLGVAAYLAKARADVQPVDDAALSRSAPAATKTPE
jgi:energy-coupling factor transport system substrate-specific component